jgi:hypothetical protein
MKKNLLTLVFVVSVVCFGATFASAKTSLSSKNSASASKKASAIKAYTNKIKTLKAKCKHDCGMELQLLMNINDFYESACAPQYLSSCEPGLASAVITAGGDFEACLADEQQAKKMDRTMDRNKIEMSQVQKSKV